MSINFVLAILAISVFTDDSILANRIAIRLQYVSQPVVACNEFSLLMARSLSSSSFALSSFCFPFICMRQAVSLQLLNYFN